MAQLTPVYIISEVFIGIMYVCLCLTYFSKYRKQILILNLIGHLFQTIAFIMLGGITGAAMDIVSCARDLYIFANDREKNTTKDKVALVVFFIFVAVLSALTFDGILSLLSVFGTVIFTISIWQKDKFVYKLLGIPTSLCWLGYNIFVGSVLAIHMESVLLLSTVVGTIGEYMKSKKKRDIFQEEINLMDDELKKGE